MSLGPIGQGKLWQLIEMAAMITVGSMIPVLFGRRNQMVLFTAYSAIAFLSGKMAYGATQGLLQRAELFSTMTDRFIGGGIAILIGTYAGKKFLDKGQQDFSSPPYLPSLATSAVIALVGVGLRELAWAGVKHFIPFKA
ncbi:MAG TPA: hypothetical protein VFU89_05595 [Rhabdochlamydiaceae bacterium]|nr:hypothetical protein [Rhabdochlamydiaceae bacterium]